MTAQDEPDAIDAAIAAGQQDAPAGERRDRGVIKMASGRVVNLDWPATITDAELLDVVKQIVTAIRASGIARTAQLSGAQPPSGQVLVPKRQLLVPGRRGGRPD